MFSEVIPSFSPLPHHVFLLSAGCKVCVNKCVSLTGGTARGELSLALSVTTLSQRMNHLQLTPGICKGLFHGSPNLFSSVTQSCPTLCNPMNPSTPGLPVHHQIPKFTQTHVDRVGDAIQPSHPLSSPSPPAPNPSQYYVFSNESTLHMRWPKYWSFSFSISLSNEHPGLISLRR